uniref:Uncharacterized protein n=1 Tax=Utricularia reniformis TaxID=192314 RepID=A0A1Y0B2C7_9LAMI|nr:hypothetical protein AEK19_MT1324 [Utricularia reniformis]ART31523.1 hypothetical protein AEK19_MT1324 [Utricularia reniformis]
MAFDEGALWSEGGYCLRRRGSGKPSLFCQGCSPGVFTTITTPLQKSLFFPLLLLLFFPLKGALRKQQARNYRSPIRCLPLRVGVGCFRHPSLCLRTGYERY